MSKVKAPKQMTPAQRRILALLPDNDWRFPDRQLLSASLTRLEALGYAEGKVAIRKVEIINGERRVYGSRAYRRTAAGRRVLK